MGTGVRLLKVLKQLFFILMFSTTRKSGIHWMPTHIFVVANT